ncbi:HTH domain-containing protein [Candidatus Woesearchaeota archaeon]|nr:HTH domain-containing protein [Candidatus Woesearchaeota archaeon]
MIKKELIYREILFQVIEKKNNALTQAGLSKKLKVSLSTVNNALKPLDRMNAIKIEKMNFKVVDARKLLYYWACERKLEKDVVWGARVNMSVVDIEKEMPDGVVFTSYSAYKFNFNGAEADYSEVYVYGNADKIKKRFAKRVIEGPPNLFVLKMANEPDYGKTATIANIFVDLWNAKEWYARNFLEELEIKIKEIAR